MLRTPLVRGVPTTVSGQDGDAYVAALVDGEPFVDDVLELLVELVDDGCVVVDVGANVGVHAVALARAVGTGRVLAFEPSPSTADHLERTVEANGLTNVEVHRTALGDGDGELSFFHNTAFPAGSTVIQDSATLMRETLGEGERITVPVTTLDAVTRDLDRVDVVKVDAEGHDAAVLRGSEETLRRLRPVVLVEFAGYALTMHAQVLPQAVLAEVRARFERVLLVEGGTLREVRTDRDALDLLYENATSRPVMDLVCVPEGARLAGRVDELVRRPAPVHPAVHDEVAGLRAEAAALGEALASARAELGDVQAELVGVRSQLAATTATLSWRVTRPLRLLRGLRGLGALRSLRGRGASR